MMRPGSRSKGKGLKTFSLFSGIAGLERGLARSGHITGSFCESNAKARAVLGKRYPDVPVSTDVQALKTLPSETGLLTAGFPCQDLSQVGRTNGHRGKDSGLVRHVFRLLRKIEVPWVLLENVPFMLWLNRGAAMDYVIGQLERLGYNWAYRVVDTQAFGMPQRRERVFILASLDGEPERLLLRDDAGPPVKQDHRGKACGFYWTEGNRGLGWAVGAVPPLKGGSGTGIPSSPAIWLPDGQIVTPDIRDAERLQGFPSGWTSPANSKGSRRDYRWRLVGNAVTVQVAEWLGRVLVSEPGDPAAIPVPMKRRGPWPRSAFGSAQGRFAMGVSSWPARRKPKALRAFLRFPTKPLSERASSGFLNRLEASSLRVPADFLAALKDHVELLQDGEGRD